VHSVAAGGRLRVRSASRLLHSQSLSLVGTLSDSSLPSLEGDRVSLQLWGDIILEHLQDGVFAVVTLFHRSYNDLAGRNGSRHCRDATMLRDNLVGLIEPMLSSAGANPLALCSASEKSSDDRPPCLENPRPEGAESTLTENAASPFHAELRQ